MEATSQMATSTNKSPVKIVASNRKARHDYHIEDTFEAGIVLTGSEIKSIRAGQVNLRDSFAMVRNGELWLMNSHIAPYHQASYTNPNIALWKPLEYD